MHTLSTVDIGNVVGTSAVKPGAVNGTYFYCRVTGFIVPSVSGDYTLGVNCADGCNLFIGYDQRCLVDNLSGTDAASSTLGYTRSGTIALTAGAYYPIVIEWQHGAGSPYELQLIWTPPLGSAQLIPSANLSDAEGSVSGVLQANWWNGTSGLWYPSGNGVIDFAAVSHPNKHLDNISDGTTYARVKASGLSSGVPFKVIGSGTSQTAASAGSSIATASNGNIVVADGAGNLADSGRAVSATKPLHVAQITIDGGGFAITTGFKGSVQYPFSAGTIVGWSIEETSGNPGSVSVEVWKHSGTQTAPNVPGSSDKISASAPISLSSASANGSAASGVSTWTTAVAQWDSIGFNVASASTVQRITIQILIQEN